MMKMKKSIALLACTFLAHSSPAANAATVTQVNYTDASDGSSLSGYLAVPDGATADDPRPVIVLIGNWDGVNDFERERAEMFTNDLGYVTMAVAIYNSTDPAEPVEFDDKLALATRYRSDPALGASRIDAAMAVLKGNPFVDMDRVAFVGYCLGGSIALMLALGGRDDVSAVAAFHGGLDAISLGDVMPVKPKVLILSGGEDSSDSTASIIKMEEALNAGNATWQISRYSGVVHSFANHLAGEAYDEYVGPRSHANFYAFVKEAFGETEFKSDHPAEFDVKEVKYSTTDDGFNMTGYVSLPEGASPDKALPAVIIIHDASGVDDYEKTRAQMLSDEGYIAFAADVFGDDNGGYDMTDMPQLFEYITKLRVGDIALANKRINAAIDAVLDLDGAKVDPTKIALIGYCFGGTAVINYAMSGETRAKGIASFHGGLAQGVAPVEGNISAAMLIQSGGVDDAASDIEDLEAAMNLGNTMWEYSRYSDVEHSFTKWGGDQFGDYNARADVRSWDDTKSFFVKLFEDDGTTMPGKTVDDTEETPEDTPSSAISAFSVSSVAGLAGLVSLVLSLQ